MTERTIPHDLPAEKAILGAVLMKGELLATVAASLAPEAFFREAHRLTYRAMLALAKVDRPIDLFTLRDVLGSDIEEVGGVAYLSRLTDGLPNFKNIQPWVDIVNRHAKSRALVDIASRMTNDALDGAGPDEVADEAGEALFRLGQTTKSGGMVRLGDTLQDTLTFVETHANARGKLLGLQTGFDALDDLLGGLAGLVVIGARPGMGKTSFVTNVAANVAAAGHTVLLFSLEMAQREMSLRLLSSVAQVSGTRLTRGYLGEMEYQRVGEAASRMADWPLYLDDSNITAMFEIVQKARGLARSHDLKLVIVDYLQLLPGDPRLESRQVRIADISRQLKQLSRSLGVPVIALSQLSRATEDRATRRPQMSDLRESGALEQDADVVLLIHREEAYKPTEENRGIAELLVEKQRSGATGVVKVQWIAEQTRFASIEPGRLGL